MYNPLDLTGKTILVTGASSGIGRGCAQLISQLGGKVVCVARDEDRLKKTVESLEGTGHFYERFDFAEQDLDTLPAWIKPITARSGPLSGLVHSAGISLACPVRGLSAKNLTRQTRVNLESAAMMTKAFRQKGCRTEQGSVIYISSVMALVGGKTNAGYCATKGGLVAMAKAIALELAPEKIRVNCLCPANVKTELSNLYYQSLSLEQQKIEKAMHPIGDGEVRDVANAVAFLLADCSRWITGSALVLDGGYTIH